jgi:HEAT repeat protein
LLGQINDTNYFIRKDSIVALSRFHAEPELVVPVLIRMLSEGYSSSGQTAGTLQRSVNYEPSVDQINNERMYVARALGNYGREAKSAVPALLDLINNSNPVLRSVAEKTLAIIDPESVSKKNINQ